MLDGLLFISHETNEKLEFLHFFRFFVVILLTINKIKISHVKRHKLLFFKYIFFFVFSFLNEGRICSWYCCQLKKICMNVWTCVRARGLTIINLFMFMLKYKLPSSNWTHHKCVHIYRNDSFWTFSNGNKTPQIPNLGHSGLSSRFIFIRVLIKWKVITLKLQKLTENYFSIRKYFLSDFPLGFDLYVIFIFVFLFICSIFPWNDKIFSFEFG